MIGAVFFLASSAIAVSPLSFISEAKVTTPLLRLGDVADVNALPLVLRQKARALVLMRLSHSRGPIVLKLSDIASRARSLMPSLGPWVPPQKGTLLLVRRTQSPLKIMAIANTAGGITKNDKVRVKIEAGSFTIEREGIALSHAKPGETLFIRTPDRKALSAQCCGE